MKNKLIDLTGMAIFLGLYTSVFMTSNAFALNRLKNGFETMTNNYLIPLSSAVAGTALILFVIISYFKPENVKQIGMVLTLAIITRVGLELIETISQSFSQGGCYEYLS